MIDGGKIQIIKVKFWKSFYFFPPYLKSSFLFLSSLRFAQKNISHLNFKMHSQCGNFYTMVDSSGWSKNKKKERRPIFVCIFCGAKVDFFKDISCPNTKSLLWFQRRWLELFKSSNWLLGPISLKENPWTHSESLMIASLLHPFLLFFTCIIDWFVLFFLSRIHYFWVLVFAIFGVTLSQSLVTLYIAGPTDCVTASYDDIFLIQISRYYFKDCWDSVVRWP